MDARFRDDYEPAPHASRKVAPVVHRNLPAAQLVELALARGEGQLSDTGALVVTTGKYTGRSPRDKFIVDEPSVHPHIGWGPVNQPFPRDRFDRLYERVQQYLRQRNHFIFDGFAGADPAYRLRVRVVTEYAWHSLFARQLFLRPEPEELRGFEPDFTVLYAPTFHADPRTDGTRSETFILVSFERRTVLIGGTEYAGEIKKSIFSVLNYLLPERGVLPMHCSANVGPDGDVALFFGLSGTGKTTLSADPERRLIGDDEHGWSERGIFNFEGGCYAKCINLSREYEPQIWNAIRFGAVLENVILDPQTRQPLYDRADLTENTRAAYPVEFIDGAVIPGVAGHARTVFFLSADAFGVLPPIARLTPEQAMYYFLSGYTSKLAGTERGVTSPEATFSTCFGEPFLPRRPVEYARMLGERLRQHGTRVYLVNTGWTGGPYGVGSRMKLPYTRAMIRAALRGELDGVEHRVDPVFGLAVPVACPGVPSEVLDPRGTWADPEAYDRQARELAARFVENFRRFEGVSEEIKAAGPRVG
ncbi:phosphoenolpyruvate carboxykinase (ATP) [Thermaerobacter subterraneus]|uniref:Phosphoenolpyruvate carboxykinase (ATP) n=1 Tax=Thermaerobacter subterraneus DSM 13965 TaxID=867903 RepID=K6Q226_9FIRM|nr:phosphoenolpyruvate carboxykinase (ATP) [Thermaerobacter subterraneus]EKP95248.1 ATP-dependent phosphoenolpyruvate carboxykinase [Thermaerobacter subterraneus DSM 13965]